MNLVKYRKGDEREEREDGRKFEWGVHVCCIKAYELFFIIMIVRFFKSI